MLSIVIVNWKTCGHLRRCLQSLETHGLGDEMRVVVVDNASGDGSAEMVREGFAWVRLVALDGNVGYAEGNNIGIAAALNTTGVESEGSSTDPTRAVLSPSDLVLTLNPDVEFFDDSLRIAVDEMRRKPDVGAMGIRLVDPDGVTTQASIRSFPRPSAIVPEMLGLSRLLPGVFGRYRMHGFDYGKSQEVDQPMGTFVLYRRVALSDVSDHSDKSDRSDGPFDPQFPIFFNEVDLLRRIANAGWKIWYCAEARLKHHGGASTRQVRKPMIWESHRSLVRYYRKWYLRWWNSPLFWLFAGLVYLGAFVRARGYDAGFRP
ncbi:MAG: glycosyltransferase family 2 protein [Fimbriimonadales bacterium]